MQMLPQAKEAIAAAITIITLIAGALGSVGSSTSAPSKGNTGINVPAPKPSIGIGTVCTGNFDYWGDINGGYQFRDTVVIGNKNYLKSDRSPNRHYGAALNGSYKEFKTVLGPIGDGNVAGVLHVYLDGERIKTITHNLGDAPKLITVPLSRTNKEFAVELAETDGSRGTDLALGTPCFQK